MMGWDLGRVGYMRGIANSLGMDERLIPDLPLAVRCAAVRHRMVLNVSHADLSPSYDAPGPARSVASSTVGVLEPR